MRDEMLPGTDVAVYWIEHVLHHGTKHLQLASKKLNFFQKYLIDVWFFLGAILVLSTSFLWLMCRRLRTLIKQKIV
jgi:glucuronosyltransferase